MRLLVRGSRDFENLVCAFERLDQFKAVNPVTHVIHGAARSADTIEEEWAKSRSIPFTRSLPTGNVCATLRGR